MSTEDKLNASVLVLNRNYTALRVVNAKRAFTLLYKDSAEVIEQDRANNFYNLGFKTWIDFSQGPQHPADNRLFVRTPRYTVLVPRVIRLMTYDKPPKHNIKFNRKNILARDNNTCQYCGKRYPSSFLSIDHVVPKSRGGVSAWNNVVTACHICNTRKGGKLLSEVKMRLIRTPTAPRYNPSIIDKLGQRHYKIWSTFVDDIIPKTR
jgi:5-methylcytosine-specific restriction endonuclease McrA